MIEREYSRVVFKSNVILQGDSATLEGEIRNLCLGGIFVDAKGQGLLPVDESVVLSIMVEGKSSILTIRARGKVLRHQGDGLAIQFDIKKLEIDSLNLLKTVILTNGGDPDRIETEYNKILQYLNS